VRSSTGVQKKFRDTLVKGGSDEALPHIDRKKTFIPPKPNTTRWYGLKNMVAGVNRTMKYYNDFHAHVLPRLQQRQRAKKRSAPSGSSSVLEEVEAGRVSDDEHKAVPDDDGDDDEPVLDKDSRTLALTDTEVKLALQLEGLLNAFDQTSRRIEGWGDTTKAVLAGDVSQVNGGRLPPHRAWVVVRKLRNQFAAGLLKVPRQDVFDTRARVQSLKYTRVERMEPAIKIAMRIAVFQMDERFYEADENLLLLAFLDPSFNMSKFTKKKLDSDLPAFTSRDLARADECYSRAIERYGDKLRDAELEEHKKLREEHQRQVEAHVAAVEEARGGVLAGQISTPQKRSRRERRQSIGIQDGGGDSDDDMSIAGDDESIQAALALEEQDDEDELDFVRDDKGEADAARARSHFVPPRSKYDRAARDAEKAKFAALGGSQNIERFVVNGVFMPGVFWAEYQDELPIHAAIWRGQSASLVNSCNVEGLFSLAGRTWSPHRSSLDPEFMQILMFIAYNWDNLGIGWEAVWKEYKELRKKDSDIDLAHGEETEDEIVDNPDGDDDCEDMDA